MSSISARMEELRADPKFGISSRFQGLLRKESQAHSRNIPMAQTVVERALRVRIITGFTAIICLTILISCWSYFHISKLGASTENLFVANYRSIQYAQRMDEAVDALTLQTFSNPSLNNPEYSRSRSEEAFKVALQQEFENVTEPGEAQNNKVIQSRYQTLVQSLNIGSASDLKIHASQLKESIAVLRQINETAMFRHADAVQSEANFARLSSLGISALLIAISILLAIAISRRSLAEFRELDQAKSNFVATAAHELKNPLSSIKTSTGLLLDGIVGKLSESQETMIESIRSESERLLSLVRELLELARLEAGTLALAIQETDVTDLINGAVLPFSRQALSANVGIEVTVLQNVPMISVDTDKITWAISNLLSNALRYAPRGSEVGVTARRIDNELWISVTDTGRGIAQQDHTRIFQKFVQVEDSVMGAGTGSGLGLAIAKEIVQLHNGRIWTTSSLGAGASFTIALPIGDSGNSKK